MYSNPKMAECVMKRLRDDNYAGKKSRNGGYFFYLSDMRTDIETAAARNECFFYNYVTIFWICFISGIILLACLCSFCSRSKERQHAHPNITFKSSLNSPHLSI
jgi:hypothetical protein